MRRLTIRSLCFPFQVIELSVPVNYLSQLLYSDNVRGLTKQEGYSYVVKPDKAHIYGFHWTGENEVLVVSTLGFEWLQITPKKKQLKSIKVFSLPPCL